jgi:hypothetical protein
VSTPSGFTLGDFEARLALFAEGIAGRYLHIKATSEFSARRFDIDPQAPTQTSDTLYLPEHLPDPVVEAYPEGFRVLVLQQIAARQCGTFAFRFDVARARIAELALLEMPGRSLRLSERTLFYRCFERPRVIRELFEAYEAIRIDAWMADTYPGIGRHLRRYYSALDSDPHRQYPEGYLEALYRYRIAGEVHPSFAPLLQLAARLKQDGTDVYDSARAACEAYALIAAQISVDEQEFLEFQETSAEWSEREARLEDWEDELANLDSSILALELIDTDNVEAQRGEEIAGEILEEALDIANLKNERDRLSRRLDMERSAVRDTFGEEPQGRSFRYDEWDYLGHRYLKRYCRLFEVHLAPTGEEDLDALKAAVHHWRHAVQRQLEHIKPLGFQRMRRVADGDELDIDAIIEARQDARTGHTPDDRTYSRRERIHRDVCAVMLVDLSASTDDPIDPPEPIPPPPEDAPVPNLRDPYSDDSYYWTSDPETPEPKRRIIDVQQEATLIMAAALDQLGDSYGIYGFSGYGHDCVEFYAAKEICESFTPATVSAIGAMRPKRSTRMGPAIRHAVTKLIESGNALKVLLVVSDGFPQDSDYGPERGNHEYGLQDTARALSEAHAKGVETFCVTVDRSGHDYLKRMCPESRYMVIEEIEDLPAALSKVYATLTGGSPPTHALQ